MTFIDMATDAIVKNSNVITEINSLLHEIDLINKRIDTRLDTVTMNGTEYTVYVLENLRDDLKKALKNLKKGR
jgi:hypothetical protein